MTDLNPSWTDLLMRHGHAPTSTSAKRGLVAAT
jgi:hypothetical protein